MCARQNGRLERLEEFGWRLLAALEPYRRIVVAVALTLAVFGWVDAEALLLLIPDAAAYGRSLVAARQGRRETED